jgi:hypothetical protein
MFRAALADNLARVDPTHRRVFQVQPGAKRPLINSADCREVWLDLNSTSHCQGKRYGRSFRSQAELG